MSRLATSFVLGYHGCDEAVGRRVLNGEATLLRSDQDYDWLGPGIYFWEGDPRRAREWAEGKVARGRYARPFVLGAVIDLGNCLDLLTRENIELLRVGYESVRRTHERAGKPIPRNRDVRGDATGDKLLRDLDCAVIREVHGTIEESAIPGGPAPFDTVRGLFTEGEPVYPGGGFHRRTHTQVAVRKEGCIKGYFLPRDD